MLNSKRGFTLIELLIVIGIISILAGIVLVAVNPAQQFGKANDSQRKSEISSILSAIYQFQTSPTARGAMPQCTVGGTPTAIPDCGTNFASAIELGTAATAYNCSTTLVPAYLNEMPKDPSSTYTAANTGYYVCQQVTNNVARVYVIAAGTEVFKTDGGCKVPTGPANAGADTMCVSG
jgi:prepilin-type N-terminal cleavage/methylation domain-containing protein